jgi:hypothetical protein
MGIRRSQQQLHRAGAVVAKASLTNIHHHRHGEALEELHLRTYPSGTGTLATQSCGASDGCTPNAQGDYLYTVLYYLTTTAGSGGTAFLTVTWTDLNGRTDLRFSRAAAERQRVRPGQVVAQHKSGTINITPGWANASGSPSVSWGYLVQR